MLQQWAQQLRPADYMAGHAYAAHHIRNMGSGGWVRAALQQRLIGCEVLVPACVWFVVLRQFVRMSTRLERHGFHPISMCMLAEGM